MAIAAKLNTAMWRAYASIKEEAWVDAVGMPGAQVAAVDYAPAGWPEDTYTIVRRVRLDAEDISGDPRSRRRRTIDSGQLALVCRSRCRVDGAQPGTLGQPSHHTGDPLAGQAHQPTDTADTDGESYRMRQARARGGTRIKTS